MLPDRRQRNWLRSGSRFAESFGTKQAGFNRLRAGLSEQNESEGLDV
jgi:hypothetical protein